MESARGRAFLEEHARRSRVTETATLLTAIGRIEDLLVSRGLEPAGQTGAEPSATEAPASPQAEPLDADVFEAETPQNENSAPRSEEREFIVSPEMREIEITSFEVTADQASAIEFLGPESVSTARPDKPQPPRRPQSDSAQPQPLDPFADICALSDEEKIALFA